MSNIVKINDTDLQVIEHQGQRVVTLGQIDDVHSRPDGTARRTFNEHKHRLVEGEDFFVRNAYEARELGFTAPNGLVLVTEQGYTMLVKPFTDDLAWQVQRQVVSGYFRVKGAAAARTAGEVLIAQAQAFYALEQAQSQIKAGMARLENQVEDLAESRVWDHCPQNCEPITKIEKRINERYALPNWVIDKVVRQLPFSPKIAGMVRNQREEAKGSQYAVFAVADISRIFAQFVKECVQETPTLWSHRDIEKRFQLLPNGRKPKQLRAHAAEMEPV